MQITHFSTFPGRISRTRVRALAGSEAWRGMNWGSKTNPRTRRAENIDGPFYVDHTCIDCDTCRWMAPEVFGRSNNQSAVHAQPQDKAMRINAMQALLSCPTFSIHTAQRVTEELRVAQASLPAQVPGCPPGVHFTGWADEQSFGCAAYLVVRPQGNILVDSPRFNPVLARRISELGGVKYIFLTHRDDVGDHARWAAHFGAQRILHAQEVNTRQGTHEVEVQLQGGGPWVLTDTMSEAEASGGGPGSVVPLYSLPQGAAAVDLTRHTTLFYTPGHTQGHVCMLYGPARSLFSGDHLCSDTDDPSSFYIFTDFNWHSVPLQLDSVAALRDLPFLHVLPGHGRRAHLRSDAARKDAVDRLMQRHAHTPRPLPSALPLPAAAGVAVQARI